MKDGTICVATTSRERDTFDRSPLGVMIIKIDVICPFCLGETGCWKRWKIVERMEEITFYPVDIETGKRYSFREQRPRWGCKNEEQAQEWERSVLQAHLVSCPMKDRLTNTVLELYNLN